MAVADLEQIDLRLLRKSPALLDTAQQSPSFSQSGQPLLVAENINAHSNSCIHAQQPHEDVRALSPNNRFNYRCPVAVLPFSTHRSFVRRAIHSTSILEPFLRVFCVSLSPVAQGTIRRACSTKVNHSRFRPPTACSEQHESVPSVQSRASTTLESQEGALR
jgi:hypothetical protein